MYRRWIQTLLIALSLLFATVAHAARDEEGRLVRVDVVDAEGRPIPNAWVRVPDTEGRRRVDPETGVWEARYLYAYDGMEIFFEPGMVLELTISAPGYHSRVARYKVRRGKNQLTVTLKGLPEPEATVDDQITWFRRSTREPEAAPPATAPETPPETAPAPAPTPEDTSDDAPE